ncbi:MAG: hypothetical protein CMP30_04300 [Roseibacillus sp.]|nr:hypothetical protein [Roseibacillus sp.]
MAWYISKENEREGPINGDRLRSMIITGEILSTDLVAWGEQGEWIEAGQVSDFSGPDSPDESEVPVSDAEDLSTVADPGAGEGRGSDPCKDKDLTELGGQLAVSTDEEEKVRDRSCGDKESEASGLDESKFRGGSASNDGSEPVGFPFPEGLEEEGPDKGAAASSGGQAVSAGANGPAGLDQEARHSDRVVAGMIDFTIALGVAWVGTWFRIPFWFTASLWGTFRECYFFNGQSIGKKAMCLRTVTRDGKELEGKWDGLIFRNAVFFIPLFVVVEGVVLTARASRHRGIEGLCRKCGSTIETDQKFVPLLRLGDEWAGTRVIKAASSGPVN